MRLALIHGFMGDASSWDEARAHARSLPPRASCLRPLGHGEPSDARDFDAELRRLLARLDAEHTGRWVLAGYSLGARIALGLLAASPARFAGALLIAPHPGLRHASEARARRALDEQRAARLESEGLEAFVDAWERLPLFETQRSLSGERLRSQRRTRLSHDASELARSLRVLGLGAMPACWPALETLPMPIAWLVGERDARFVALAEAAVGELADGRLSVAPEAGHNLLLERPAFVAAELDALWGRAQIACEPARVGSRA
jgi:2-succinyl-6-hydroxy-2,4-cyclohexadiene-1-carboxylate synthase